MRAVTTGVALRLWMNLRIHRTTRANGFGVDKKVVKKPSYPHIGDNHVENVSTYPQSRGITEWTTWGHPKACSPDSLISIYRSERKVICTPLFRKRREIRGHIGLAHARNRRSHVVSGGVVHGAHQRFTPFGSTRTVWRWSRRTWPPNEEPSARVRSNSMSSSTGLWSSRPARSSPTLGSLGLRPVANSDNVRCSRTSSVTQRTMSRSNPHALPRPPVACRAPCPPHGWSPRSFAGCHAGCRRAAAPRNAGRRTAHRWVFHGRAA